MLSNNLTLLSVTTPPLHFYLFSTRKKTDRY